MTDSRTYKTEVDFTQTVDSAMRRMAQAAIYAWRYAPGPKPAIGDFAKAVGAEFAVQGPEIVAEVEELHRRNRGGWNTPF